MSADASVLEAIANHQELIKGETLTLELEISEQNISEGVTVGDEQLVAISVAKL